MNPVLSYGIPTVIGGVGGGVLGNAYGGPELAAKGALAGAGLGLSGRVTGEHLLQGHREAKRLGRTMKQFLLDKQEAVDHASNPSRLADFIRRARESGSDVFYDVAP